MLHVHVGDVTYAGNVTEQFIKIKSDKGDFACGCTLHKWLYMYQQREIICHLLRLL